MSDNDYNYRGFSLARVSWGYRQQFRDTIDALFSQGFLKNGSHRVSAAFFRFVGRDATPFYDTLVKEFLTAVNAGARWMLSSPSVFEEWCALGAEVAGEKFYLGMRYFRLSAAARFGRSPREAQRTIALFRDALSVDVALAISFLDGLGEIRQRLDDDAARRFLDHAKAFHRNNPELARDFVELKLKTSHIYMRELTREARLEDLAGRLERILLSLSGAKIRIASLAALDSDELIERHASAVFLPGNVYLPARIGVFDDKLRNRALYLLAAYAAAVAYEVRAFPALHGLNGIREPFFLLSARNVRSDRQAEVVFAVLDTVRVFSAMREKYPGLAGLIRLGVETELAARPFFSPLDQAMLTAIAGGTGAGPEGEMARELLRAARGNTLSGLLERIDATATKYETLFGTAANYNVRAIGFYSDYFYPAEFSRPPDGSFAIDLKDLERENRPPNSDKAGPPPDPRDAAISETGDADVEPEKRDPPDSDKPKVGFFYDEWNGIEGQYYDRWCVLREFVPKIAGDRAIPASRELDARVAGVVRTFERLRPDAVRKEKRLPDGDELEIDLLLDYLVARRAGYSPREEFYSKPLMRRRDIAVAVLMDVSGSTANLADQRKILDLEKEAVYILAEGLARLGDKLGVFGFTGNGREDCQYLVFKDFAESWDDRARERLFAATPGSSTRIGVALRHTGWRLANLPALKKIVILLTDGKPMDSGYEPATRYAQLDVRMACEENRKKGISTFCISTEENSIPDMEIMFPQRRFVILENIEHLPETLSRFYLKLTS